MANKHKSTPPPVRRATPSPTRVAAPILSNEMEERDPTDEEIASVVGVGAAAVTLTPTTPYDPSRDDDEDDGPPPTRPVAADPAMDERILKALESLQARQADTPNDKLADAIALLAVSLGGLKESQIQGAQLQADMHRRINLPENRFTPNISAYNPRGDKDFPRPKLKCEMFLPWPVEPEAMTREEIELLNLLTPGEYYIVRSDRSKVKLTVNVQRKYDSEEVSRVLVNHDTAFNNDYHKLMPFDWIRQLAKGCNKDAANAVLTMEEEVALIEAGKLNDGSRTEMPVSVGA